MTRISQVRIAAFVQASATATTRQQKGKILEDLVCYLFGKIPGITVKKRNSLNTFNTEEIDVAIWNDRFDQGLPFLPYVILIECKNWNNPVSSIEVSWFDTKLRNRGLTFGVLVAMNGITGDAIDLTDAHKIIADALKEQRNIIVITLQNIKSIQTSSELVTLFKEKLTELAVTGTTIQ